MALTAAACCENLTNG